MIEADIADRLNLSRTPVRGALQRLEREGYVRSVGSRARSRMVVSPLTREDVAELYAIIGHLEGLGARNTAALEEGTRLKVADRLTRLNKVLSTLARARRAEPNRIFETDLEFHRTILRAAAGPRLLEMHDAIQPQVERYWRLYSGAIVDELSHSVNEHEQIISALREGDADAAEKGLQVNWMKGLERLSRVIDSLGERGNW